MVYKGSNIRVLLGPESLKHTLTAQENGGGEFPSKFNIRKSLEHRRDLFDKIGDSNVYKRTRPHKALPLKPPALEKDPTSLELSGKKVETDEEREKAKADEATKLETLDGNKLDNLERSRDVSASSNMRERQSVNGDGAGQRQKSRQSRSSANIIFSRNVLTEFGLSPQRTDTFSGHQRRRGQSADIERQFEAQAERHIRTCQTVGNVKWSSRANRGCQGLKSTVSPLQSPMSFCSSDRLTQSLSRERSFYRSDTDLDRSGTSSYFSQIRKHVSRAKSISQSYQKHHHPLPEITNRTLIIGTSIPIS